MTNRPLRGVATKRTIPANPVKARCKATGYLNGTKFEPAEYFLDDNQKLPKLAGT